MDQLTAYRILNLHPGCSIEEIKEAYAALSKQYHPEEYPEQFQQIHEAYRFLMKINRQSVRRQSPVDGGDKNEQASSDSNSEPDTESFVLPQSFYSYDYESVLKRDTGDEEEEAESSIPHDFESVIKRSVRKEESEPAVTYDFEAVLKQKAEGESRSYQFDGALGQYGEYERSKEDIPDIEEVKRKLRRTFSQETETKRKKFRKSAGEVNLKKKKAQQDRRKRTVTKRKGRRSAFGGGVLGGCVLLRSCVRLNSSTGNAAWGVFAILIAWILGLLILYLLLNKKFSNLVTQIWLSLIISVSNLFILGSEAYASMLRVEAADSLSFWLLTAGIIWFLALIVIAIYRGICRIVNKKNNV